LVENPWNIPQQVRSNDKNALEQAKIWLQRAQELNTMIHASEVEFNMVLHKAQIYRLEGNPNEAVKILIDVAASVDDKVLEFQKANYHGLLATLYIDELQKPDLAASHFEKAIHIYENLTNSLDWNQHRTKFRENFAGMYFRMVECALSQNQPEIAFHFCERAKIGEMRRLWSLRQSVSPKIPDLQELVNQVSEKHSFAIIEFLPSLHCTYAFLIAPGLPESERVLIIDRLNILELAKDYWIRLQNAYENIKSPFAVLDDAKQSRWLSEVKDICQELGDRLLSPIYEVIKNLPIQQIIFIPHSLLHCFPLHAAPLSETEFWIDRYCISYAPSATVLMNQWSKAATMPKRFIGFADSMGDLPMSRIEIKQAKHYFQGPSEVYCGEKAAKEQVMEAFQKADWIHFACHATHSFLDNYASGVRLAAPGLSDGKNFLDLFTINRDILLPINSTIILSACETGTVSPQLSDEFISLSGGFIAAGARTVVASYWIVRDTCTALLMERFYSRAQDPKIELAQALREAELWIRDLSEKDAFENLERLLNSCNELNPQFCESVLAPFSKRRLDHCPFWSPADWAAFNLSGATELHQYEKLKYAPRNA